MNKLDLEKNYTVKNIINVYLTNTDPKVNIDIFSKLNNETGIEHSNEDIQRLFNEVEKLFKLIPSEEVV